MKKILILLTLLLAFVSCTLEKEPYESMTQLAEYEEIEIKEWFRPIIVKATHEWRLNDNEKLYYVPNVVKVGDDTFKNEVSGYYIQEKLSKENRLTGEITYHFEYNSITEEEVKELLE